MAERPVRCTESATFVSKLSPTPDIQNVPLTNVEARLFRLADTTKSGFYRVLSDCIRRLLAEVHSVASMHGYFDYGTAVAPRRDLSVRQDISGKRRPRAEIAASSEPDKLNGEQPGLKTRIAGSSFNQSAGILELICMGGSWFPCLSFPWLKCAAGISSAAAVVAVIATFSRSGFYHLVIVAPVLLAFAIVASCLVVWGQLELSVRHSSKRICQLIADLQLQHKLAGEILELQRIRVDAVFRWIQELEFTFKAFPGSFSGQNQEFSGAFASAPPCADGRHNSSEHLHEASPNGPPHCKGLPCCQNEWTKGPEWRQLRPNGSRLNEPCAWNLRMRLYQVLDWQQRVFCYLYEDIVRWRPERQHAWESQISEGPWRSAERSSRSSYQFDGSLRTLKEMTSKSWLLHASLLGGVQVALRHLLSSLDARLVGVDNAAKRKLGSHVGVLCSPSPKRKSTRHASRALKQALLIPQQHHSANGCRNSLREEINQAANAGHDGGGGAQILKSCLPRHGGSNYTASSRASVRGQKRATASPVALPEEGEPGIPKQCNGVLTFCKALCTGLFGVCAVLDSVADGIRALVWLFRRLYRLGIAMSAADQVAVVSANALRMILEEDWASSPICLPQPRWGEGVRKRVGVLSKHADADAKNLKLAHWAASPPSRGSHHSGTFSNIASDRHRDALASMSRNVAATLALLRLPGTAYGCHMKCAEGGMPEQGKSGTASSPVRRSADSGSVACLSPMNWRSLPGAGQGAVDAELCGPLHLVLRHLRVALEEGQKLERSLRLKNEKGGGSKTFNTSSCSEEAPVQPAKRETHSDDAEQPLQPILSDAVKCLEVYTAVGQDSITNKRRFREEEGLKEAFAEDEPAVRERSQVTLKELQVKLKKKVKERQCMPFVLKELSVTALENADGSEFGEAEDRAVVRIVSECSRGAVGVPAVHSPSAASPNEKHGFLEDAKENGRSAFTSVADGNMNAKDVTQQGFVGASPEHAENIVLEAESHPEETFQGVECLDNEQVAFKILHQKFKGCSSGGVSFSPEARVTHSLMSQLRCVLKRQKKTPSGGHDLLPSTLLSLGVATGHNESGTFGDSAADEGWSACDVVEGPSCAADAPAWVAAPFDVGDSDSGTECLNGQRGNAM